MNTITETTNRNNIKQANCLVQAKYSLSALATDLLSLMLTEIMKEHKKLPKFEFRFTDIENKMNKKLKWEQVTKAAEELTKCEIEIDLPTKKMLSHWCSFCSYSKTGERILELTIDSGLQEFLINFSDNAQFTISHFNTVASLRSVYSKRIYTMLMQFSNAKSPIFIKRVEDLKGILEVGKKYNKYSDFKRFVLDIAIKQINENKNSEIKITGLEESKRGRYVETIKIHFERKSKSANKSSYKANNKKSTATDSLKDWLEKSNEDIIEVEPINTAVSNIIPEAIDARTLMGM